MLESVGVDWRCRKHRAVRFPATKHACERRRNGRDLKTSRPNPGTPTRRQTPSIVKMTLHALDSTADVSRGMGRSPIINKNVITQKIEENMAHQGPTRRTRSVTAGFGGATAPEPDHITQPISGRFGRRRQPSAELCRRLGRPRARRRRVARWSHYHSITKTRAEPRHRAG